MNAVYTTNINGLYSSLWVKTNGPSVNAIVLFCFGAAPLSKIAQLQSPRAHSFNQSLSWPYRPIFVYQSSFFNVLYHSALKTKEILLKKLFFEKIAKNPFFSVKNFCDKLKKNQLELLKLLENHVKTQFWECLFVCLFLMFILGNIFENFDQRGHKI